MENGVVGVLIGIVVCVLIWIVADLAQAALYTDLKKQCEQQGSIRLKAPGAESLFFCSREPATRR